jgi:lysophospholipase L1-like esterase
MNINPKATRILCFGDSNTWGRVPGDDNLARYNSDIRWTGVLQKLLGNDYEVIEEGLNGRTTNHDSPNKAGKNGATYLFSCLESQNPLDLVILFLGGNDLKAKYNLFPEDIGNGIEKCIDIILDQGKTHSRQTPEILVVSPAVTIEKERIRFGKKETDLLGANEKSKKLSAIYRDLATKHKLHFIDLSPHIESSSIDGIHLEKESHKRIAELFFEKIGQIWQ